MEKDSIPGDNEGVQDEHSLQEAPADTVDENQPSNEDDNSFWETNEEEDDESDAPSQTTQTDDDTTDESDDSDESSVDPELKKWADSQNISLETETEIKLAKRLRDTQKGYHEAKAKSKQDFDKATNESTEDDRYARIEARLARNDFFESHPDARDIEGDMYDYAVKIKESGDEAGFNYYTTPKGWETLYKIVKAEKAEVQSEDSYSAGRTDERKNLAKKQQASTAKAKATNTAPDTKSVYDKLEQMSPAEFTKYLRDHPGFNPFGG